MVTSSNNLYDLIKESKVEILSVTQKYTDMPDEIYRITTYNFIKDLKHLVKTRIFNNVDWKVEKKSGMILLLTSNKLDKLCGTYLEVEITPVGNTIMQQVIDKLKETIFSKPAPKREKE